MSYLNDSEAHWMADGRTEGNAATTARVEINRTMEEIHSIIMLSGINPVIIYTPPPAVGGYVQNVDVVYNIFNLHRFDIPPQALIDYIDRAIGVYASNSSRSFMRTVNPFYWIGRILESIVRIPFVLLGKAGFNQNKVETSLPGKILKGLLYLIIVFASFLTVLQLTGYLDSFNRFIRSFIRPG